MWICQKLYYLLVVGCVVPFQQFSCWCYYETKWDRILVKKDMHEKNDYYLFSIFCHNPSFLVAIYVSYSLMFIGLLLVTLTAA